MITQAPFERPLHNRFGNVVPPRSESGFRRHAKHPLHGREIRVRHTDGYERDSRASDRLPSAVDDETRCFRKSLGVLAVEYKQLRSRCLLLESSTARSDFVGNRARAQSASDENVHNALVLSKTEGVSQLLSQANQGRVRVLNRLRCTRSGDTDNYDAHVGRPSGREHAEPAVLLSRI
jgi:hypothetical protein